MSSRDGYAADTKVPVDQSRREIEALLAKAGADSIAVVSEPHQAMIAFRMRGSAYRFTLPIPAIDQLRARRAKEGLRTESLAVMQRQRDQLIRSRWRALLLALKAKIEAARAGIIDLEVALMPFAIIPGGRIVADEVLPKLAEMRTSGRVVPLLPGAG